jgi:membrane fusion protein
MSSKQLFRQAALDNRQAKWLGDIILMRPLSFSVLTACAGLSAATVLAFLFWGSYTKRSTVAGQLIPDTGLLKIYAPQAGVLLKKNVVEGQAVRQGDVLFVLSSERQSSTQGNTQAAISSQVESRQQSLRDEMRKTERLQQEERAGLVKKIAAIEIEHLNVVSQLDGQKSRVKLAEDGVSRAQQLLSQHFISQEQLQQKQADLLDQQNRLQTLERDQLSLGRELSGQQNDLATLPLRHQNQMAQMARMLTSTSQELTESEARRSLSITAPESGIATAVAVDAGQAVDSNKPMVSIVPRGARLQADLYAPSKAIGFIKPGDAVLLRYQAYPYQKFGHATGSVLTVSKTALPANEINSGLASASQAGAGGEPMYRITVKLNAQTVNAYGKAQALQAGMLLEADVLQEKRRLVEWVLEPLYSLTGKI